MKAAELFEATRTPTDKGYYTPGYDDDAKIVVGQVKDWMARIGATAEDIAEAVKQAKELPSYSQLKSYDKSTPREAKNGTFSFKKPQRDEKTDEKYMVYANGQIRSSSLGGGYGSEPPKHAPTRLKSPKPALVAGDAVKSLVKIYDGAFKELGKKMDDRKAKKAGKIPEVAVTYRGKDYILSCEQSKFDDGFRAVIKHKDGKGSYISQKSFNTPADAVEHARKVFNGDVSGFRY
jgi:hypothetical protein